MSFLLVFSSALERDAAFPNGVPPSLRSDITGVGLVDAAAGTSRIVARHTPAALLFVGTCGAYPGSGFQIGQLLLARSVRLGSGDVASRAMRIPGLMPETLLTDPELTEQLRRRLSPPPADAEVICTLGITESESLARQLESGIPRRVENLEAYPVLRAAAGIPTAILLGVTNIVGPNGGKEWKEHFRSVMQAAVNAILRTEKR